MRADRRQRAVECAERGGDQRLLRKVTGIRDEIARGEIVGAVGDDVVARNQVERVARIDPRHVRLDGDMRIEPRDGRFGAIDLALADIVRAEDHLPLQIGQRHGIVVDDADRANAGGGEIHQHRRPEPAGADDQNPRSLEPGLAGPAHVAQDDVAGVAFEFFTVEHGANVRRGCPPGQPRTHSPRFQGVRPLPCRGGAVG